MAAGTLRCFVAVELANAVRESIVADVLARLPRSRVVRWCNAAQLHITLKFIAALDASRLDDVRAALAAAARDVPPFELQTAAAGVFPDSRRPRVLWLGVHDPAGACAAWVRAADALLRPHGVDPEQRAVHPHITLGRSKGPEGGDVIRALLETLPVPRLSWRVERLTFFESRLGPGGSEYRVIDRFRLGRGAAGEA